MISRNRDMLVLTKRAAMNAEQLEHEIELLNNLLYLVESCNTVCLANEIIDLNRYKIIHNVFQIRQFLKNANLAPFVFICNKN